MSEQDYPDYCAYCTRKYNNTKCLLPYALATSIVLSSDPTDRIVELTELHCSYRTDSLRHQAEVTLWHLSNSDQTSGSVFGPTRKWVVYNNALPPHGSSVAPSTLESGAPLEETPSQPGSTEPKVTTGTRLEPSLTSPPVHDDCTSQHTDDGTARDHSTSPQLTTANLEQHEAVSPQRRDRQPLTLKDSLHLARDITLALVTAQNLRKTKRHATSLADLLSSYESEKEIKLQLGTKYVPSDKTKLDHQIAFVRELIAHHSQIQLSSWTTKSQAEGTHPQGCILHYNKLNPYASKQLVSRRLDNYLLAFARNSVELATSDPTMKKPFIQALKSLLAERNMATSLEWLLNAPLEKLYLADNALLSQELKKHQASLAGPTKPTLKLKETEPPIPKHIQELLTQHLSPLIDYETKDKASTLNSNLEHEIRDLPLTDLTTHVIRYNPRWISPIFNVTTHMTESALLHSEFKLNSFNTQVVTHSINGILKRLRTSQSQN
jgi:hypothetical protein